MRSGRTMGVSKTERSTLHDPNQPPSPKQCQHCDCCDGYVRWDKLDGYWRRKRFCMACQSARKHNFDSHREYEQYVARGCWVCEAPAQGIDHDHKVCRRRQHSCDACRRGPVCNGCNIWLREGLTSETASEKASTYETRAKNGFAVAAKLAELQIEI